MDLTNATYGVLAECRVVGSACTGIVHAQVAWITGPVVIGNDVDTTLACATVAQRGEW